MCSSGGGSESEHLNHYSIVSSYGIAVKIKYYSCIMTHVNGCMLIMWYCSLSGNSIGNEGCTALSEALKVNTSVTTLE